MKHKFLRKPIAIATILAAGLAWSNLSTAAGFMNGNFSDGFNNWQGQDDFADFNPVPTNANFDAASGAAVLTTDFDAGGSFAVSLFQTFTIQNLMAAGNTLTLDFDLSWASDHMDDWLIAQMVDTADPANFIDFVDMGGSSFDITDFAGLEVELLFGLENNNGGDDSLTIDNIMITQNQPQNNNVPEPGTLLLLGAGMAAMRRKSIASWVSPQAV